MSSHAEKGLEMSERGQASGLDVSVHAQAPPRLSKADKQKTKIDLMKERGRRVYSLGYFLRKLPWVISYPLIGLFAGAVIVSFFGFVPLKDPDVTGIKENAVFGFFVLPFVFTIVAYLNASMFYAALQINKPFVNTLWVVLPVYIIEAVIFGIVTWKKGCINLIGGAALLTCFFVLWTGMLISVRWIKSKRVSKLDQMFYPAFMQYLKVTTVVFIWTLLLIGYIFAFRYGAKGKIVQRVLPALRNIFLFAFRKTTLHLCDSFPLDIAMLIAGFWCEQLADMFSVVSYPTVKNPKNFYVIWASNAVSLLANLLFLTPGWFRFRLWIKNWLKAVFTCNFPIPPTPSADETEIPDERGHGPNRQGYLRRQVRFFLWKVAGQGSAEALYLALVPLLRLGRNSKWFVFSEPTNETFRYSMMFSGANLGFIVLCGIIGIVIVRLCLPKVARVIWKEAKDNITDLYYVSFVIAITCANAFIVFSIVMRHMKIWYAYIERGENTLNL